MEEKTFKAVNEILEEGYGEAMAKTLINVVPDVMDGILSTGAITSEDCKNVRNLLWLYKALLKDLHGIDHGVY